MNKPITIAVDAMGGDNSPNKVMRVFLYTQKILQIFTTRFLEMKS